MKIKRTNTAHPAHGDVTYIISAEREENGPSTSHANVEATARLAHCLERILAEGLAYNVHPIAGAYCGRAEESFAVVGKDTHALLKAMLRMAGNMRQESVLHVDFLGRGALLFPGIELAFESIGTMVSIDPADVATLDAFSVIKSTGEAFTFN